AHVATKGTGTQPHRASDRSGPCPRRCCGTGAASGCPTCKAGRAAAADPARSRRPAELEQGGRPARHPCLPAASGKLNQPCGASRVLTRRLLDGGLRTVAQLEMLRKAICRQYVTICNKE